MQTAFGSPITPLQPAATTATRMETRKLDSSLTQQLAGLQKLIRPKVRERYFQLSLGHCTNLRQPALPSDFQSAEITEVRRAFRGTANMPLPKLTPRASRNAAGCQRCRFRSSVHGRGNQEKQPAQAGPGCPAKDERPPGLLPGQHNGLAPGPVVPALIGPTAQKFVNLQR
jgi:hypothetical protein